MNKGHPADEAPSRALALMATLVSAAADIAAVAQAMLAGRADPGDGFGRSPVAGRGGDVGHDRPEGPRG